MLAHSCLIKCGAVVTTEGVSIGYLAVARLENDADWYVLLRIVCAWRLGDSTRLHCVRRCAYKCRP